VVSLLVPLQTQRVASTCRRDSGSALRTWSLSQRGFAPQGIETLRPVRLTRWTEFALITCRRVRAPTTDPHNASISLSQTARCNRQARRVHPARCICTYVCSNFYQLGPIDPNGNRACHGATAPTGQALPHAASRRRDGRRRHSSRPAPLGRLRGCPRRRRRRLHRAYRVWKGEVDIVDPVFVDEDAVESEFDGET
jgi:hypothetical protein